MTRASPKSIVVACIIEQKNDVLICTESGDDEGDRVWEFPCGEVVEKETPEAAMRRIAHERVGLEIDIHTGQPPIEGSFSGRPALFRLFLAFVDHGEAKPIDYREVRWTSAGQLREYDFAPVYGPIIDWYLSD